SRDLPAGELAGKVPQQRGLARARLATQDGDPAPAGDRVGQQPVERLTLAAAPEELRGRAGILTRRRPPCTVRRLLVAGISTAYICGRDRGPRQPKGPAQGVPRGRRTRRSARVIPDTTSATRPGPLVCHVGDSGAGRTELPA